MKKNLRLVLSHHWYDATRFDGKRVEYRKMSAHWEKMIWSKKDQIKKVTFSRGYTKTTQSFDVHKIDIGRCPLEDWDGLYYRIHFS